jgi:uncharacterized membrane-anchored protein
MSAGARSRRVHRWASLVFTATVVLCMAVVPWAAESAAWVFYLPLPPLVLQMFTGLFLFALPYAAKRRKAAEEA